MNNLVIDIIYLVAKALVADVSLISEGRASNCGKCGWIWNVFVRVGVDSSTSLLKQLIGLMGTELDFTVTPSVCKFASDSNSQLLLFFICKFAAACKS